jgi:heat-inducible transcriptional repressor
MVRTIDHETRKKAVLAAVINKYIKDPEPVASEDITREFSVSSATIRSIFAELEEDGYLTHPYTSAGRIPTDKGYRYYVDFLLSQIELLGHEKQRIVSHYKREITRLEDALEKTSEVVSAITHYASVVSLLNCQDRIFYKGISFILDQPEFQDLSRMRFLIKMIEEKEEVLDILNRDFKGKIKIYIGEELGRPELNNCSMIVSSYNVRSRPVGRLAIVGPTRMDYDHIIPTLEYVSVVLSEVLDSM